MAAISG